MFLLLSSYNTEILAKDRDISNVVQTAIQTAISKGKDSKDLYVCNFEKEAKIKSEELKNFFKESGQEYMLIYTKTYEGRAQFVQSFKFLPFAMWDEYIYSNITPSPDIPFSSLSQTGSAYVYLNALRRKSKPIASGQTFVKIDKVHWSGKVENGMLQGEGIGFLYYQQDIYDEERWVCFAGNFNQGFPENFIRYNIHASWSRESYHPLVWGMPHIELNVGKFIEGKTLYKITSHLLPWGGRDMTAVAYEMDRKGVSQMCKSIPKRDDFVIGGYNFDVNYNLDKLMEILEKPENKENPKIIGQCQLLCAEMFAYSRVADEDKMRDLLKTYPEIANGKDIEVQSDSPQKVSIKESYLKHLYKHSIDKIDYFNDVYNDNEFLTEYMAKEIDEEHKYILSGTPKWLAENYLTNYPKGYYSKWTDNYDELWAHAYVDYGKRVIEKWYKNTERPSLDEDMVPTFRKKSESALANVFTALVLTLGGADASMCYLFNADDKIKSRARVFYNMKEGTIFEEAKCYRNIVNSLAIAERLTPSLLYLIETDEERYVGLEENLIRRNGSVSAREPSYRAVMRSAIRDAHDLAAKEGTQHPEYQAAENFISKSLNAVEKKLEEVREGWADFFAGRAQQIKRWNCENCKLDGSRTTFPKGWVEGYSFLFMGSPSESEEEGTITFKNGNSAGWKYFDNNGKIRVKCLKNNKTYDRVSDMIDELLDECKKKYCGE